MVRTVYSHCRGAQVRSRVRELRSHMPCDMANIFKRERRREREKSQIGNSLNFAATHPVADSSLFGFRFSFLQYFKNVKTIFSLEAYKNRLGLPQGCSLQPTAVRE